MAPVMTDQDTAESTEEAREATRKRKISSILTKLDNSKFIPAATIGRQSTFAPWDRHALSTRLLTFRPFPIHHASSPINALFLARRGWTLVASTATTIACSHCHARVVIGTSTDPETMRALEERFATVIAQAHLKKCPWSQRECGAILLRVPLADRTFSLESLETRVESYSGLSQSQIDRLDSTTIFDGAAWQEGVDVCRKLAICGWSAEQRGTLSLLVCNDCHGRLSISQHTIDAMKDHYDYCPWVNSSTQGGECATTIMSQHWTMIHARDPQVESAVDTMEKDSHEQVRQVRRKLGFV